VKHVAGERPDAIVYCGTAGTTFAALLVGLRAELPGVPIWGGAGLATASVPAVGPGRVAWLQPVRPLSAYPPEGRRLLSRIREAQPETLYGYESMRVVLRAIERGGGDRHAVARAAMSSGDRRSPLGPYDVLRSGDISERRLALYDLAGFEFDRLVESR
jgi:hypothetical protein